MTATQSHSRLALYVGLAVLGSLVNDFIDVETLLLKNGPLVWIHWPIITGKAIIAGGIVWRAYIDQSPSDVKPKDEQP